MTQGKEKALVWGENDKKAHGHGKHWVLQPPHLKRPLIFPVRC